MGRPRGSNFAVKVPIKLRVSRIFDFPELMVDRGFNVISGDTAELPENVEVVLSAKKAKDLVDRYTGTMVEIPENDIKQIERVRARKILSHPAVIKHMKEAAELIMSRMTAEECRDELTRKYGLGMK